MAEFLWCKLFPVDLDAAVRFYADVLGFDLVRDERASSLPYVALARDAARLGLVQRGEVADGGQRRPPVGVEAGLKVATWPRPISRWWPRAERWRRT